MKWIEKYTVYSLFWTINIDRDAISVDSVNINFSSHTNPASWRMEHFIIPNSQREHQETRMANEQNWIKNVEECRKKSVHFAYDFSFLKENVFASNRLLSW